MNTTCRRYGALLAVGLCCLAGCEEGGHFTIPGIGYTTRPPFDLNIKTVYVPIPSNLSYERGIEFDLHKAVQRELANTPYRLTSNRACADSELVMKIMVSRKSTILLNQLGEARDVEKSLAIEVVWRDLRPGRVGDTLSNATRFDPNERPLPGDLPGKAPPAVPVLITPTATYAPELGGSNAIALKQCVDRAAMQIVNMMEVCAEPAVQPPSCDGRRLVSHEMYNWRLRDRVLSLDSRCFVMGIVNVTPDSFSDGGQYFRPEDAVSHGLELVRQGADLLDVGGESTRPGSTPVELEEELRRVLPVVTSLAQQTSVPISVDTSKAAVARACLQAGAHIINDVTGLMGDPHMVDVAREAQAGVIVMHMQGTPATMQMDPQYQDVILDLSRFFTERIQSLTAQGIAADAIMLDPGIGFGKTHEQTLTLLAQLSRFDAVGRPLCLGVSRKGFIGIILNRPRDQRAIGSLAVAAFAFAQNAVHVLRVHDVAATRDLVLMWETLRGSVRA